MKSVYRTIQRTKQRLRNIWVKLCIRYFQPGKMRTIPTTLTIELTNRCTLACSCCPNGLDRQGGRSPHTISATDFRQLLQQIDIPFKRVFLYLHGEPFLANDLPEITHQLITRGAEEFVIFSNAYHIDFQILEEFLSVTCNQRLNIAFSGEIYDTQTYERVRYPGHFDTIWQYLQGIDDIMARYNRQYSINAIIYKDNIDQLKDTIPDVFRRLKQLKQIHFNSAFPWPHLPETGDIVGHLSAHRSICSQIWQLPVVFSSGEVSMCSSDYRGECVIGSLWTTPYSQLINNKPARRFRRNIAMRHCAHNNICRDCLIDRYIPFSRVVRRTFIEKADESMIERYFAKFHNYFDIYD